MEQTRVTSDKSRSQASKLSIGDHYISRCSASGIPPNPGHATPRHAMSRFGKGSSPSLTFSALVFLVIVSRGVSAASFDQPELLTSLQTFDDSLAFVMNHRGPTAIFNCVKSYWGHIMKHVYSGMEMVKATNRKLVEFFPKMHNCSLHTSGLIANLQCRVGVVLEAGVNILELYNQIKNLVENASTTFNDVHSCISEERHGSFKTENALTQTKNALQVTQTKNALLITESKSALQAMERKYPLHYRRLLTTKT